MAADILRAFCVYGVFTASIENEFHCYSHWRHEGRGLDLLKHMPKIWTREPLSKVWTFNTDNLAILIEVQEKDFKLVAWCLDSHDWTLTTSFDCQDHRCPQKKPGMKVSMDAPFSLAKPSLLPVILAPFTDLPSIHAIHGDGAYSLFLFSWGISFYTTSSDTGTGRKGKGLYSEAGESWKVSSIIIN